MKTNKQNTQSGNVLIYVLIAIALFAALSFTLSRQTDTSEASSLTEETTQLHATQLISYASQTKSVIDQMLFSGARVQNLDFTLPNDTSDFNDSIVANNIYKVYHPEGGGLNFGKLSEAVIDTSVVTTPGDPAPGWYLGRFNDVEWSAIDSSAGAGNFEEVILTAYGIKRAVCENINEKITGTTTIPTVSVALKLVLVDQIIQFNGSSTNQFTTGSNQNLTTDPSGSPVCSDCHNRASLCVQEGGIYAFYTVIADL